MFSCQKIVVLHESESLQIIFKPSYVFYLLAGDIGLNPGPINDVKLSFTNIRSIHNKSPSVTAYIVAHNINILETWLMQDETPSFLSDITPDGYQLFHKPCINKVEG